MPRIVPPFGRRTDTCVDGDEMKIRILGCSGGIGGQRLRTTSMLVDDDVLIDCGTGVGDLSLDELLRIDHVFLTHSHLDHIAGLPLLIDTVGDRRNQPLTVHATEATLEILRTHIFNWAIWPDFSEIPDAGHPHMRYDGIRCLPARESERPAVHGTTGEPHGPCGGLPPGFRCRQPGPVRGHRAVPRILASGERHRQSAFPDCRDCVFKRRKPPGEGVEALVSEHAGRGAGPV